MIISVHIPKTAGTSFRYSLEKFYGDKLLLRYGEAPFALSKYQRNLNTVNSAVSQLYFSYDGINCVHGHFLPMQYLLLDELKPLTFITWLRNPVDRLFSHYYHVRKNYKKYSNKFNNKVVEENWSVEEYCLCEETRNFYKSVLWAFPLEYFDFIGITEHYNEDFRFFANKYLNADIYATRLNINEQNKGVYHISKSLRKRIEAYHHEDMKLYERALEMRKIRMNKFSFIQQATSKLRRLF